MKGEKERETDLRGDSLIIKEEKEKQEIKK
jgi:hypothetical protein